MHDLFNVESFGFQILAMASTALLCLLLGIERYFHQKNAGVKTHVLVGLGACLFTLVSGFGFAGATGAVDPSRIAAQIVSGIGFLGAGLIFVNNDTVKGLTTAATIWVSAAIGMACGAGLVPLAFATIAIHYVLFFSSGHWWLVCPLATATTAP
ncbi:MgtC/SapB family protein [Trueperella pyogenes]|uniref:MgtC/SapB family protein n=1 Tax=Trueperella pyogenes TaxID=1661 RepID=UPI0026890BBB